MPWFLIIELLQRMERRHSATNFCTSRSRHSHPPHNTLTWGEEGGREEGEGGRQLGNGEKEERGGNVSREREGEEERKGGRGRRGGI